MSIISQAISRLHNFQPGKKAFSAQVNAELDQIIEAINSLVTDAANIDTLKATVESLNNLAGTGRTTETVIQNAINLTNHKTSGDHDSRYYTKTQLDAGQLNSIYYTKAELTPFLRGGDTLKKEEVFTIVSSNNGDGTFTYSADGVNKIGQLTAEGYQIFNLTKGVYTPGENRLDVYIDDTLRRSASSGGIIETSTSSFALALPEGVGREITAVYFERLGIAAEYNIKLGTEKPPANNGKNMWFKIIG